MNISDECYDRLLERKQTLNAIWNVLLIVGKDDEMRTILNALKADPEMSHERIYEIYTDA